MRLGRRLGALLREGVDHRLRAREAGVDADRGDAVRAQLVREGDDEAGRGGLHDVVRDVAEVVVAEVGAAGDHDQARAARHHRRRGGAGGGELRAQAGGEHRVPARHRLLPERVGEAGVALVAAPGVGDEEVEAAVLLGRDAGEHRLGLGVVGVVGGDGDAAAAAGGDRVGGVLDGAAAGSLRARGAARDVDRRAAVAEGERDAATDPRLAPVTTATRPRRSGACQVMAPSGGTAVSGAARPAPARSGTPTPPACAAPGGSGTAAAAAGAVRRDGRA